MIYSHGGDVVKFCGDALMCIFNEDREKGAEQHNAKHLNHNKADMLLGTENTPPSKSCMLSMQCALRLMEKLRFFVAAEGVVLDLKIMLGNVRL